MPRIASISAIASKETAGSEFRNLTLTAQRNKLCHRDAPSGHPGPVRLCWVRVAIRLLSCLGRLRRPVRLAIRVALRRQLAACHVMPRIRRLGRGAPLLENRRMMRLPPLPHLWYTVCDGFRPSDPRGGRGSAEWCSAWRDCRHTRARDTVCGRIASRHAAVS